MTTRRNFIRTTCAGAAGLMALSPSALFASAAKNNLTFGFIGGIVREELKADWRATLVKAAEFGFKEIETGTPPGGATVVEFLTFCKQIGITPVAGGVSMTDDPDVLRKRLDEISLLNVKYAINYWPWFGGGPFMLEDCKRSAPILNMMGEVCKEYGLTFCWHNHEKEFFEMEEGTPFDYLMEHTDEDLVKCQLDVFWAAKGDADPVECMQKYSGRYPMLHLKDMTACEERTFECVGSGIIDFPAILKEAQKQNIQHFMVEHDTVVDGLACLESSSKYLHSIKL